MARCWVLIVVGERHIMLVVQSSRRRMRRMGIGDSPAWLLPSSLVSCLWMTWDAASSSLLELPSHSGKYVVAL